jgi:hypothetical protein
MATDRARSATPTNQTPHASKNNLTRTVKYNYRIQSAPPLSLQQFLRSSTGILAGAKEWRPSGKVNQPKFNLYLSPAVYEKKKPVEPKWNPPGRYREKPLTSLSPEKVVPKHVPEPVWHPPGRYREKPPTSLSPETIVPKRVSEPVWHPPGPFKEKPPTSLNPEKVIPTRVSEPVWHSPGSYRERPPTSLSPERIIPTRVSEPVWRPPGKFVPENVPYFDPPSLRWSLQELLRSMPEMRPKAFHMSTSRSMSALRKSTDLQQT